MFSLYDSSVLYTGCVPALGNNSFNVLIRTRLVPKKKIGGTNFISACAKFSRLFKTAQAHEGYKLCIMLVEFQAVKHLQISGQSRDIPEYFVDL